jgi:hypothetical protein
MFPDPIGDVPQTSMLSPDILIPTQEENLFCWLVRNPIPSCKKADLPDLSSSLVLRVAS